MWHQVVAPLHCRRAEGEGPQVLPEVVEEAEVPQGLAEEGEEAHHLLLEEEGEVEEGLMPQVEEVEVEEEGELAWLEVVEERLRFLKFPSLKI